VGVTPGEMAEVLEDPEAFAAETSEAFSRADQYCWGRCNRWRRWPQALGRHRLMVCVRAAQSWLVGEALTEVRRPAVA
jgi:hypothetical protein